MIDHYLFQICQRRGVPDRSVIGTAVNQRIIKNVSMPVSEQMVRAAGVSLVSIYGKTVVAGVLKHVTGIGSIQPRTEGRPLFSKERGLGKIRILGRPLEPGGTGTGIAGAVAVRIEVSGVSVICVTHINRVGSLKTGTFGIAGTIQQDGAC